VPIFIKYGRFHVFFLDLQPMIFFKVISSVQLFSELRIADRQEEEQTEAGRRNFATYNFQRQNTAYHARRMCII
jgi:hypothetical protein